MICPNPPEDRFEKVAPVGTLFFPQTEERKDQFLQVLLAWSKSWEKKKSNRVFWTPLLVTPGAPGDGKTHFEWILADRKNGEGHLDLELERALEMFEKPDGVSTVGLTLGAELKAAVGSVLTVDQRKKFADRFRKAIGVSVTFNFNTLPSSTESASSMVAVRMLYSHFCRGDFYDFLAELKKLGFDEVDEQAAFDLIRADIDKAFPNENRAVILVVDEVLLSKHEDKM